MATHVADEIDRHVPLGESPAAVRADEAVAIASRHDGLQRKILELLEDGEVRARLCRARVVVDVDDDVGRQVAGARGAVRVTADTPCVESQHRLPALGRTLGAIGGDAPVFEERCDAFEVAAVETVGVREKEGFDLGAAVVHGSVRNRSRLVVFLATRVVCRRILASSVAGRIEPPDMHFKAVIFDIGGVVVGSPLHAIAEYELANGIAAGTINRIIVGAGAEGSWARLERGELLPEEFFPLFDAECAAGGCSVSGRVMMATMAEATVPRPAMLVAIDKIRASGRKTAALTNNWKAGEPALAPLASHFDVIVESAVEGMRKPDPRIYQVACDRLGVGAENTVFLDDIGTNLKAARALGMRTIKVVEPGVALAELGTVLELDLAPAP